MPEIRAESKSVTDSSSKSQLNGLEEYFLKTDNTEDNCFEQLLMKTVSALATQLQSHQTPSPNRTPTELQNAVKALMNISGGGTPLPELLDSQVDFLVRESIRVDHPHCAAHLHCPPLIPAIAAELVLSTLNQSMDSWDQATAATYMEQALVDWLCQHFGYNDRADGTFTSGGTQSNLMGLLLARDAIMNRRFDDSDQSVQQHGLCVDHRRFKILCSKTAHFSIAKSCAVLGMGAQSVIGIDTDLNGAICIRSLERTLEEIRTAGDIPLAVVATAGTTDLGAIDPIDKMADLTQKYECWLHIDAAYGGALILSKQRNKLAGIHRADSITVDFHKLFFQPVSCGALLVRDKQAMQPLCFHADYLSRENDPELNLVDKSLSTTRRFDAFKLWLSLHNLGTERFGGFIDQLLDLTQQATQLFEVQPKLRLLQQPTLTTLLFRFTPKCWQADEFHQKVRRHLLTSGQAVIAETRIEGKIFLKLTLMNPAATIDDLSQLLDQIISAADTLCPSN